MISKIFLNLNVKLKLTIVIFVILFQIFFPTSVLAAENTKDSNIIRLAIVDNFKYEINSGGITSYANQYMKDIDQINSVGITSYANEYLKGIDTAKYFADKSHYKIKYKLFTYGTNSLDVLKIISKVKAWNPDVIIGPRGSNIFLLLNGQFSNILVISPLSSSSQLSKLPNNFYSTSLPDRYTAKAIVSYIERFYPKRGLFTITQADCKNCVDLSELTDNEYSLQNNFVKLKSSYFIEQNVSWLKIPELLAGYRDNELILMTNMSYASAILMPKIVNYLKKPVIFIGADDWGTWYNTEAGKINADYFYEGIRFSPWSFQIKSKKLKEFLHSYQTIFGGFPKDRIGYISYNSVISIITALQKYGHLCPSPEMKEKILCSYTAALKYNPNWYRPNSYAVYSVKPSGEHFLTSIKVSNDNE